MTIRARRTAPRSSRGYTLIEVMMALAVLIVAISSGVAKAYQSGPPAVIATFDYTYLVFAALWSFVFFSELPDAMTALGMLLIAGAGILAISPPQSARRVRKQAA